MDELREAFQAAYDEDEANQAEDDQTEETTVAEDTDVTEDDASDNTDEPAGHKDEEKEEVDKGQVAEEKSDEKPAAKAVKAPASWSPKNREHWDKLPADVQAQVSKREAEVNNVLQQSAESRRLAQELNAVLAPHKEGMIAAGHNNPLQAISGLLQTESTLRVGSMEQKAQGVATIIRQYGIDIDALSNVLAGQPVQETANAGIEAMLDQRMAPMNQFLQQQEQMQQNQALQTQQDASTSVENFRGEAEFLDDVRMDMADLMDMAAKRGQQMTIQDAYQKACAINPEVSGIIEQRDKQKLIMGTDTAAQQKKAASVSLTGTQGGTGGGSGALSLRDQIADAWNSQSG